MERDDIIEYSLDAHHSEEKGKEIRKGIVKITVWLTLITIVEVVVGVVASKTVVGEGTLWDSIKFGYIVLTLVKAGMIVMSFMHLGDERKSLKLTILVPYIFFMLYLIFICFNEAVAVSGSNFAF